MPDSATVVWIAGGLGGALSIVAMWAWNHTHKRIDDVSDGLKGKAENSELTRVRDTQSDIFDQIREHDQQDRERHTQVIQSLGRLEGKVDGLLMRDRKSDRI